MVRRNRMEELRQQLWGDGASDWEGETDTKRKLSEAHTAGGICSALNSLALGFRSWGSSLLFYNSSSDHHCPINTLISAIERSKEIHFPLQLN
ncbi:hypothetical protein Pfo_004534 [Paulownia fortunei]|nr:hypothetical protein Pfo_004534 [Paulownia fortunei]